jgi:Transposase domain (DUF772)
MGAWVMINAGWYYSLSDEATEFQIKDRLSFQRFLGLGLDGTVPDATTVWLFRERLVEAKAMDKLFARFDAALTDRGYLAMGGQIIDATVVPAPKQRNTEEEKAAIKEGRIPDCWKGKPAKIRQKDRDARWSVKYTRALSGHSGPPGRSRFWPSARSEEGAMPSHSDRRRTRRWAKIGPPLRGCVRKLLGKERCAGRAGCPDQRRDAVRGAS